MRTSDVMGARVEWEYVLRICRFKKLDGVDRDAFAGASDNARIAYVDFDEAGYEFTDCVGGVGRGDLSGEVSLVVISDRAEVETFDRRRVFEAYVASDDGFDRVGRLELPAHVP